MSFVKLAGVVLSSSVMAASAAVALASPATAVSNDVGVASDAGTPLELAAVATPSFLDYGRTDLRNFAGSFMAIVSADDVEVTRNVDGVGPVTFGLRVTFPETVYWGLSMVSAQVNAGGVMTPSSSPAPAMRVTVEEITYGTTSEPVSCYLTGGGVTMTGQVSTDGTSVRHAADLSFVGGCGTFESLVRDALVGSASIDLWMPGRHLLATEDVPSELIVTPTTSGGIVGDRVAVDLQATFEPDGMTAPAPGYARVYRGGEDGELLARTLLDGSGRRQIGITLTDPGPNQYTVVYEGRLFGDIQFPLPTSTSFHLDVESLPAGHPVTGAITIGGVASPLPADAVWVGGDYDAATGAIGPGGLVLTPGPVTLPGAYVGLDVVADLRLEQVGEVSGSVRPDGTVDIDPLMVRVDIRSATILGALWPCISEPVEVEVVGTADATGLHLVGAGAVMGPTPADSCLPYESTVRSYLTRTPIGLSIHVAGDFSPPDALATEVVVQSVFTEVERQNQNILMATVVSESSAPVSSGSVVFSDGEIVLATAPVAGGSAAAVVTMPEAGVRQITATYLGAGLLEPSSSSTSVVVTPAPEGDAFDAVLIVGGFDLGDASRAIVPSGPLAEGTSTSWAPTVLHRAAGPGGPSSAEVRVHQLSPFTATSTGLRGSFVVHLRSVTTSTGTITPLGCGAAFTLDVDLGGGPVAAVSGTAEKVTSVWCRQPAVAAWVEALTGEVSGSIQLAVPAG